MSNPTKTLLGNNAREAILRGVNAIYEPAKLAIGPAAGTALMYRTYGRGPRITEDGATIAAVITPKNEFEQLASEVFKESAQKTNERAGDGTTTTMVIGGKLINEIFSKLSATSLSFAPTSKMSVQKIKRELLLLSKQVQEKVKERAKKVETLEELERIATISLGNPEVAKIVAGVVWEVGTDGFVDVVDGYKGELETEVLKGARFAAKPGAKAFINNAKKFEMVMDDCAVLLTNYKLDNIPQVQTVLGKILPKNKKLIILAPDFSEPILTGIFQTVFAPLKEGGYARTGNDIYPVKVPSLRTEQFEDLAIYFGAKFIDKSTGKKLENVEESDLGFVEKLVVKDTENREDAVALGGRGVKETNMKVADQEYQVSSPVAERIAVLKEQIREERIESHKKLLERRIASLASAIGVIRVGASTTAESLPLKLKIEDAQYACKSALEEGSVKGGGLCLKEIAEEMPESILTNALRAPYEQIQANNEEPLEIGDDVIDPAKVVRLAVEHAVSVAANLCTVKILIPEEREKNPAEGYEEIAKAIMFYNRMWNKKEAIYKENEMEILSDQMAINEERIMMDNG